MNMFKKLSSKISWLSIFGPRKPPTSDPNPSGNPQTEPPQVDTDSTKAPPAVPTSDSNGDSSDCEKQLEAYVAAQAAFEKKIEALEKAVFELKNSNTMWRWLAVSCGFAAVSALLLLR